MTWLSIALGVVAMLGVALTVAPSISVRRERVLFGIFSAITIGIWAVLVHVLLA